MKKLTLFLMSLVMIFSCCLCGCSKFSVDYVKYYNETVAKIDDYEIKRSDLLTAYNNYGYNYYVSQRGQDVDDALESTLNLLIDRKLLLEFALDHDEYALTPYQINSVYQQVLDYLDESFDNYKTTARKMLDIDEPKQAETEESKEAFKKSDFIYKKRAELVAGDIVKYIDDEEKVIYDWALDKDFVDNFNSKKVDEIVTKLYAKFKSNTMNNRYNEENFDMIYNKAQSLLVKYLISYEYNLRDENNKPYPKDAESLIKRLIKRTYENELEAQYLTNVQTLYLKTPNSISLEKLIAKYTDLVESDYAKYTNSYEDYYNYLKTIGSNAEMIYYTPETADAKFGYFFHVLLPLDSTITSKITEIQNSKLYDDEGKAYQIGELIKDATHQERDTETGELKDEKIRITKILDEYKSSVRSVDDFIDFMFRYTSDTATLTADKPYVIGYEEKLNDEGETETVKYSGMVDSFTDEAIRLMKENETFTNGNDYIFSTYGIHLLCYVGDVKADLNFADRSKVSISLDRNKANNLYYLETNSFIHKTYFDLLFDLVYPASSGSNYAQENGYSDYERNIINSYKKDRVVIYETKLKATSKI